MIDKFQRQLLWAASLTHRGHLADSGSWVDHQNLGEPLHVASMQHSVYIIPAIICITLEAF